jgi:hypothetical protein
MHMQKIVLGLTPEKVEVGNKNREKKTERTEIFRRWDLQNR